MVIVMLFEWLVPIWPDASDGMAEPRKEPLAEADTNDRLASCRKMTLPKVVFWTPMKLDENNPFFFNVMLIDPLLMVVWEIILPNWS